MGLTNNDIFKKLRVAHKLRDEDIVKICELADFKVSKSELGAFFRKKKVYGSVYGQFPSLSTVLIF